MNYKTYIYYGSRKSKDDCSGLHSRTHFAKNPLKDNGSYYNIKNGLYLDWQDIPITGIVDHCFIYNGAYTGIDIDYVNNESEKEIFNYLKRMVFK